MILIFVFLINMYGIYFYCEIFQELLHQEAEKDPQVSEIHVRQQE